MNSLLEDLIGFARENIEKAGASFAESNMRDRQLIDAYRSGRQVDPQQRQAMAEEYINQANPMSAAGGAMAGIIKPQTWKAYTPQAKTMMTRLFQQQPGLMDEIMADPKDLQVLVKKRGEWPFTDPGTGGLAQGIRQGRERVTIATDEAGKMADRAGYPVPIHELKGHYLQQERIAKTDPYDAATIGYLLDDVLPKYGKQSMENRMDELAQVQAYANLDAGKRFQQVLPEEGPLGLGEYLIRRYGAGAFPADATGTVSRSPYKYTKGGIPTNENVESFLMRAIGDESLASLAEAQIGKESSPLLRELAKKLGVGLDNPRLGYKEQPLPALRKQLQELRDDIHAMSTEQLLKNKVDGVTLEDFLKQFPGRKKIDASSPSVKPGYARESLSDAEQQLYNKLDKRALEGIRPNIPRETTKPGTLEFWQLLRENPSAAKRFFRKELLDRWDAIQQAKAGGRRKIERGG